MFRDFPSPQGPSGPALPALGHALAGGIATASAKSLLYPLDVIVARLQVQRQLLTSKETPPTAHGIDAEYQSVLDTATKIYRHEGGLTALYTGWGPDVVKGIADSFLFFLAYTFVRQHQLRKHGKKNLGVFEELGAGVAAGAFARLLTTPIQNIVTRQQTAALVAAREPASDRTVPQSDHLGITVVTERIYNERGIQGFWAGYSASILLTLNPAITFALENLVRRLLPKTLKRSKAPPLIFILAAISKVVATSITYPVMVAKSRAQVSSPMSISAADSMADTLTKKRMEPSRIKPLWKALRPFKAQYAIFLSLQRIYECEGLSGLYAGLGVEILKGFLSHGLTMTVKDRIHVGVIQLYYVVFRMFRKSA